MSKNFKRPVYMVVRYDDGQDGVPEQDRSFILIDIKQTAFTAGQLSAKHPGSAVKKGFVTA